MAQHTRPTPPARKAYKCNICYDRFYIHNKETMRSSPCPCLIARKQGEFLNQLPPTPETPFTCPEFEALDPFNRQLLLVGNGDKTWALVRGVLASRQGNLDYLCKETKALGDAYLGVPGALSRGDLETTGVLIIILSYMLSSERSSQMFFDILMSRAAAKRPTWLVAFAVDKYLLNSYSGPLVELLAGRPVAGVRIITFDAGTRRRVSAPGTGLAIGAPGTGHGGSTPTGGARIFTPNLANQEEAEPAVEDPVHPAEHDRSKGQRRPSKKRRNP